MQKRERKRESRGSWGNKSFRVSNSGEGGWGKKVKERKDQPRKRKGNFSERIEEWNPRSKHNGGEK